VICKANWASALASTAAATYMHGDLFGTTDNCHLGAQAFLCEIEDGYLKELLTPYPPEK
jgi:hypothetical protein